MKDQADKPSNTPEIEIETKAPATEKRALVKAAKANLKQAKAAVKSAKKTANQAKKEVKALKKSRPKK